MAEVALFFRASPNKDGFGYEAKPYHGPVERIELGYATAKPQGFYEPAARFEIGDEDPATVRKEAVHIQGRYDHHHKELFEQWAAALNEVTGEETGPISAKLINFKPRTFDNGAREVAQANLLIVGDAVKIHAKLSELFPFVSSLGIPDDFERIFSRDLPHADTLRKMGRDGSTAPAPG